MTLLAYAVLEHDERTGGIIFAKSDIEARKRGADEYADGEITGVECKRAPWADEYAEQGDVPVLVMIENGWHWGCDGCERRVDSDLIGYEDDEEFELSPVEDERGFFCTEECAVSYLRDRAERKIMEQWTIDAMHTALFKRMPDAELVTTGPFSGHAYVRMSDGMWFAEEARVAFKFPGSKYGDCHFRFSRGEPKPHVTVPTGDLEAFRQWHPEPPPKPPAEILKARKGDAFIVLQRMESKGAMTMFEASARLLAEFVRDLP